MKAAIDVRDGRREALPSDATYKRAVKGMPEDRVADGYASAAGRDAPARAPGRRARLRRARCWSTRRSTAPRSR